MRYPCYGATTDLLYVIHEISIVLPALYYGSDHQTPRETLESDWCACEVSIQQSIESTGPITPGSREMFEADGFWDSKIAAKPVDLGVPHGFLVAHQPIQAIKDYSH